MYCTTSYLVSGTRPSEKEVWAIGWSGSVPLAWNAVHFQLAHYKLDSYVRLLEILTTPSSHLQQKDGTSEQVYD